jgi:hypothetical protein
MSAGNKQPIRKQRSSIAEHHAVLDSFRIRMQRTKLIDYVS